MAAVFWAMYSTLTRRWAGGEEEGEVVLFLTTTAMVAAASYLTPLFSTIISCLYLTVMPGARL